MNAPNEFQEYRDMPEGSTIRRPGKFEGEPRYVPECYGIMLDGFSDPVAGTDAVSVDASLVDAYPELKGVASVLLEISESGFVYSNAVSADELARIETEAEEAAEAADAADEEF